MKEYTEKYPALKFNIKVYKILGWVCIGVTFLASLFIFVNFSPFSKAVLTSLLTLLVGMAITAACFTLAESIQLFMDIEKNTRK